jgi:hypothetical protein
MMEAIVKYVHAISPCARDISGPFPIRKSDLESAKAAQAWLKAKTGTSVPLRRARPTLSGPEMQNGWVFFPMHQRGSVWWSVAIRLDVARVQEQAKDCRCRNHPVERKP